MGFLDRLLGREEPPADRGIPAPPYARPPQGSPPHSAPGMRRQERSENDIAVERYRYLLRTAPPETIEQVHEEAFARLTPEQRRLVFEQLSADAPAGDRPAADDPASLARSATRSEMRRPGYLENSLGAGGGRGGPGIGGMLGASLLGTVAGYVVGSALVGAMFPPDLGGEAGADAAADGGAGADADAGADAGGDMGAETAGDAGWGDFGGGDFGGGDFGGFGDF